MKMPQFFSTYYIPTYLFQHHMDIGYYFLIIHIERLNSGVINSDLLIAEDFLVKESKTNSI